MRQSDFYIRTNLDLIKFKTSAWALPEVDKADRFDLLPPSLKYADMTQKITREEFTELTVRLYEKTLNELIYPLKPNPFTDTKNTDIVKALTIGITTGTSATKFSPAEPIKREQVASMLSRTIRIMFPKGDYSTTGAPTFKDQKAQKAAGYANTTREQAIAMCVRVFVKYK